MIQNCGENSKKTSNSQCKKMLSGNPIHSVSSGRISALLSSIKKSKKVSLDMAELENINPNVYKKTVERQVTKNELNEDFVDQIDSREVFGEE